MSIWTEYNPNPAGRSVGDCARRALSKALDTDWETVYALTVLNGYLMGDMPSSNSVWGSVLRQHGFTRHAVPTECPDCYTAEEFAHDHPDGVFVLGFSGHVATLDNGSLFDSFDSSPEIVQYYWKKEK